MRSAVGTSRARFHNSHVRFGGHQPLLPLFLTSSMQSRTSIVSGGLTESPPNIAPGENYGHHDTVIEISGDASGGVPNKDQPLATEKAGTVASTALSDSNGTQPAGYERLCKLLGSDNDFLVFRRFGDLNVRNILYLQDRLSELTEDLAEQDKKPDEKPGTRRWEDNRTRAELMERAEDLLRRYNDAILSYSEILKLPRASARQQSGLAGWLGFYNPLYIEEQAFIQHHRDLLSITNEEQDAAHRLLLSHPNLMCRIFGKKVSNQPIRSFF
ncbi:hypothetical protein FN846DRAFT_979258 [Sphaerosporella brunnea]|uniref:DUF6594 domain-containing protein n=1 Tax=Sphaerosporella brunnea TaxID=1250544 RepID=A0A5J5ECT6_9PEZI|nr:hypothetical protein FN846DRAFT_979258 [Sphaerosporella brunnea]